MRKGLKIDFFIRVFDKIANIAPMCPLVQWETQSYVVLSGKWVCVGRF